MARISKGVVFWFGDYLGPYQHLYLTKLRASEFSKIVIRASNNGISAIINEDGKILINSSLNKTENIKYSINIKNKQNNYMTHLILKYYFIVIFIILILFNFRKLSEKYKSKL